MHILDLVDEFDTGGKRRREMSEIRSLGWLPRPRRSMADRGAHTTLLQDAPSAFVQTCLPVRARLDPWPLEGWAGQTPGSFLISREETEPCV